MNRQDGLEILQWARRAVAGLGWRPVQHLTREAAVSLWRSRGASTMAIGIIALSLTTVGGFMIVTQNLERILSRFSGVEFSLYLEDDMTAEQLTELTEKLKSMPDVARANFVSKEKALDIFQDLNPTLATIPSTLPQNPFPASFDIQMIDSVGPERLAEVTEELKKSVAVASVGLDHELVERLRAARTVVQTVGIFFGGILVLACLFTVANVAKLTAYAHRDEIEIMRLVGATTAFVRGTYVIEGLLQGLAGGLLGVVILWLGHLAATSYLETSSLLFLRSLAASFLNSSAVMLLVFSAAIMGMLGAALSLGRTARL